MTSFGTANSLRYAAFAAAGAILLVLTGCGREDPFVVEVCPRIGVLYDASQLTVFGPGPGRDLNNVAYDGEIGRVRGECDNNGQFAEVEIKFDVDLRAGPQGRVGQQNFQYFVAVTELNQRVLNKQVYNFTAEFEPGQPRIYETREVKNIRIPFQRLGRADLYEVLVGWELSPEQLAYNRNTTPFDRPNLRAVERP